MRLYTGCRTKDAEHRIGELLRSFDNSTKAEEQFFANCLKYVQQAKYVYCPEDPASGQLLGIGYIITPFGVPNLGMAVRPSLQGRGIGNGIMRDVLEYTEREHSILVSCLWKTNTPIINLHTKYGFERLLTGVTAYWYVWTRDWRARKLILAGCLALYDRIKYGKAAT